MDQQQKTMIKETFDIVSGGYDGKALRFFPKSAKHLADSLPLYGDERVLDVATGTGHAAFSLAARIPLGRVTGVDFSNGMLAQARRKASLLKVRNVEFITLWWDIVWNAGFRKAIAQLSPVDRESFKQEHLREVDALRTDEGIRLDVDVLFTIGKKQ